MLDGPITYTVFFKLDIDKRDSKEARDRITSFINDYGAERYKNFGWTFKEEFKNGVRLWNRMNEVAGDDMYCAYISHATSGLAAPREHLTALLRQKIGRPLDTALSQLEDAFASLV